MPAASAASGVADLVNELSLRIVSGLVMIAVALGATFLGGYWFATFVAVIAGLMFVEWTRLTRGWGIGWTIAGFLYALIPAVSLLWLRERGAHTLEMILWVFIVTWATDIGAYFAGRAIGGPKLAPHISPNKTWAGLIGGVVAAGILGGLWAENTGLWKAFIWYGPLIAVAAQMGDLLESCLKRRAGVKDSGTILPGHGGILDRLDGLVVVASFAALIHVVGTQ